MSRLPAPKTKDTCYIWSCILNVELLAIVSIITSCKSRVFSWHLYLFEVLMFLKRLPHFIQPSYFHSLQILENRSHLRQSLLGSLLFRHSPTCDLIHSFFDDPANVTVLQLKSELLISNDQWSPQICGFESVIGLDGVFSLLDGFYVLMDRAISSDLIFLHLGNEVRFCKIGRRCSFALSKIHCSFKYFGYFAWELTFSPLFKGIYLQVVFFFYR
jgi:hypothetical protein